MSVEALGEALQSSEVVSQVNSVDIASVFDGAEISEANIIPEPNSELQYDVGNLAVFDDTALEEGAFRNPEDADSLCLDLGQACVQALVVQLFSMNSTSDNLGGRIVTLPSVSTPLPREKPIPKSRPLTKWEKFAREKGIVKRKRSKVVFDEGAGEWKRRHGYNKANDEKNTFVLEAKPGDEVGSDPFTLQESEKKTRVQKQEKRREKNLRDVVKVAGKAALPSTVQLAATTLPIFGGQLDSLSKSGNALSNKRKQAISKRGTRRADLGPNQGTPRVPKLGKEGLGEVASVAAVSTASGGKFDRKLDGEKERLKKKNVGKHRKFLPVVDSGHGEKDLTSSLVQKIIAKNDFGTLDVNKAVRTLTLGQEKANFKSKRGRTDKSASGGKKRKGGDWKGGDRKGGDRKGVDRKGGDRKGGKEGGKRRKT